MLFLYTLVNYEKLIIINKFSDYSKFSEKICVLFIRSYCCIIASNDNNYLIAYLYEKEKTFNSRVKNKYTRIMSSSK